MSDKDSSTLSGIVTIVFVLLAFASAVAQLNHVTSGHIFVYLAVSFALAAVAVWTRQLVSRRRDTHTAPVIKNEKLRFGVIWDSELNPHCPVCKTLLTLSTRNLIYPIDPFTNKIPPPKPVPHCLKCDKALLLYDDNGKTVTLSEAKRLLSPQSPSHESLTTTPINQPKPVQPKPDPQPVKSLDAIRADSVQAKNAPSKSEYTEDVIGGIFWRWKQGTNYEPYDLIPYCPECPLYLQTDMMTVSSSQDIFGKTLLILKCWTPKHPKCYRVTGDTMRGPCASIEDEIRARLKSGAWEVAVIRKRTRDRS